MADKDDIKMGNELRRITGKGIAVLSGVVNKSDESGMTCEVKLTEGDDDVATEGVTLNLTLENTAGVYMIPAGGADCLVAKVDGSGKWELLKASKYVKVVIQADTLIQFNDGSLGGLVKVEVLVSKINALEQVINNLKQAVTAVAIAGSTADGGAVKAGILTGLGAGISPTTVRGDIENTKIKQG